MRPLLCSLLLVLLTCLPVSADVDCDGVDDLLTTGSALSNFFSASTGTVMGWVKVTSDVPDACFGGANMLTDDATFWGVGRTSDGAQSFCAYLYDGANILTILNTKTNGWHHLAWTHGSGTQTLYLDGVSIASAAAGDISFMGGLLVMCKEMPDRLADLRTYTSVLSVDELAVIAQSHLRGIGRTQPSGYWPLTACGDGAAGNTVTFLDRSGNGRNATGDDGANNTGLTCRASEYLTHAWGPN